MAPTASSTAPRVAVSTALVMHAASGRWRFCTIVFFFLLVVVVAVAAGSFKVRLVVVLASRALALAFGRPPDHRGRIGGFNGQWDGFFTRALHG